ncbi:MAG: hypothetical protein INQ03_25350 [Candidatus Heimdallarchaeota archaeon]|nr:hypothetical protein [Candidatus Heimdallarchaeota archaeon]
MALPTPKIEFKEARYQCSRCTSMRSKNISIRNHKEKVVQSSNGLLIYSDIHYCDLGFLGINNLQVDGNFDIRSVENLQLPKERKPMKKATLPGLPMPNNIQQLEDKHKVYYIDKLLPDTEYRIRIIDKRLRATVQIGDMDHRREKMLGFIEADLGTIELEYYACEVSYSSVVEKWLLIMVNLLEKLPPTTLGLFIETLLFISKNVNNYPNVFLVRQLQTLIVAHQVFFKLKIEQAEMQESLAYLAAKYGDEVTKTASELIAYLIQNPVTPLQRFTRSLNQDLDYLINLFLILEQEELIEIVRPAVKDEEMILNYVDQ